MSTSNSNSDSSWNRGYKGKGRCYEGRGRGYSGGRGRGALQTRQIGAFSDDLRVSSDESSNLLTDKDALERRKKRFETQKKETEREKSEEYGLTSRGEDLRLKDNESDRVKLYTKIKSNLLKREKTGDFSNDDNILMDFRKLREGLLGIKTDSFMKDVFLNSIRFSVSVAHYESYLPGITHLIEMDKSSNLLSDEESKEIVIYFILHKLHYNLEIEESLSILLNNFEISIKDTLLKSTNTISLLNDVEIIVWIIYSYSTKDYRTWLKIYNYYKDAERETDALSKYRYNCGVIMNLGFEMMIKHSIKVIGSSYFLLPKSVIEEMTGLRWETLVSNYSVKWILNSDADNVTIRQRK